MEQTSVTLANKLIIWPFLKKNITIKCVVLAALLYKKYNRSDRKCGTRKEDVKAQATFKKTKSSRVPNCFEATLSQGNVTNKIAKSFERNSH